MVAKNGFLKLKRLVGDLEVLAAERRVDWTTWILDLHRHHFAIPGMSTVLGSADHPAELRPLVVFRILHEGGDGIVNADEPFAAFDKRHQRRFQLRVIEQDLLSLKGRATKRGDQADSGDHESVEHG
jgi:hypothetical protein